MRLFTETCYLEPIEDNSSVCYDEKEYVESLSKVCRERSTTEALQISAVNN